MDRNSNMSHEENIGSSASITSPSGLWTSEVLLGVSLIAFGTAKQSPFRLGLAVTGLASLLDGINRWRKSAKPASRPSRVAAMEPTAESEYEVLDLVDEASWESFPSSDPPAFTH